MSIPPPPQPLLLLLLLLPVGRCWAADDLTCCNARLSAAVE